MPVVRAYGQPQVNLRPAADTTIRSTPGPDVFGAGLGEGIARAGMAGLNAAFTLEDQRKAQAEKARAAADDVAVLGARNALATWRSNAIYDPQNGALTVKGRDALALGDTVGESFNTTADKIAQGLSGDRQKLAFERERQNMWQDVDLTVKRHVFSEQQAYDQQETKSFVNLTASHAIAHATEPAVVGNDLRRVEAALNDHARRNGIGPDALAQQVEAVRSSIHTGVIDQFLSSEQDRAAQVYFEETKDQISGEAQARIVRALEEGKTRGEAQRASDLIMGATTTQTEALDKVRSITDPKLRDAVQQRVEHEWGIRKQAERESAENLMVTAANQIDKGGIKAVPPSLWVQLEPGQRTSLEAYAKRNIKTGDGESNLVRYYGLMQMASSEPDKFKDLNLLNEIGKLSKGDFKQLTELQMTIRKGNKPKADEDLTGFRTNDQIVNDTLDVNGIPRTGKDAKPEAEARFRRMVDERVGQLQQSTGKKATNEDVRAIADDIISKQATQPTSHLFGLFNWGTTQKRLVDVTMGDIPAATQRQIKDALTRAGIPSTDANVLQTYIDAQMRGAK